MFAVLSLLALLQSTTTLEQAQPRREGDRAIYNGRANETRVRAPKLESQPGEITIDGSLDEPAWQNAALLTGFSLYAPIDQRPAPDSTEVFVWYSSTAMYFGIRAFEPHGGGAPRALRREDDLLEAPSRSFPRAQRGAQPAALAAVTPEASRQPNARFATAAVEAIAPASPTPLTPIGLTGDGVTVSSSSMFGSHAARGSA